MIILPESDDDLLREREVDTFRSNKNNTPDPTLDFAS